MEEALKKIQAQKTDSFVNTAPSREKFSASS